MLVSEDQTDERQTQEGMIGYIEAIETLRQQIPIKPIKWSTSLVQSASS